MYTGSICIYRYVMLNPDNVKATGWDMAISEATSLYKTRMVSHFEKIFLLFLTIKGSFRLVKYLYFYVSKIFLLLCIKLKLILLQSIRFSI